ncbi:unnamed protein product [Cylindrotheca closterium]|uniref:Uncharacterized protein n=1 Tax=Cylindrotheca closterium TaxID=2856 RepID=A0AAD2FGT0_9STRA|nr:unnamed protein product [Cylindrotheca closterium]
MGNLCTHHDATVVLDQQQEALTKEQQLSNPNHLNNGTDSASGGSSFFEIDHGVFIPASEHRDIKYVHRQLKYAQKEARKKKKPIFCLKTGESERHEFQSGALNHPLVIEAVETLFVTLKVEIPPGEWDTTVVEILDKRGKPLLPAIADDQLRKRNLVVVVDTLVKGLKLSSKPVPKYLSLMLEEESGKTEVLPTGKSKKVDRVAFFGVMDSKLTEGKFAEMNGVLEVEVCMYREQQLLRVRYASRVTSLGTLMKQALSQNLAKSIYYQSQEELILARMTCDQLQRSSHIIIKMEDPSQIRKTTAGRTGLRSTSLRFVPMTDLQKLHANTLVNEGRFNEATRLLSARQSARMTKGFADANLRRDSVDLTLVESWWS